MSTSFTEELTAWGPDADHPRFLLADAQAYTRRLALGHYENFPVLGLFLPRPLHQPFADVYAYCRWADDLADEVGDTEHALELLDWWEAEFRACRAGSPRHPVMVALAETIREFDLPDGPFLALLDAFRQDQRVTRYANFAELLHYCERSANPVGHLVLHLCRSYDEDSARLSDRVCTGLQLANFWQDVGIDIRKGRVYLPADDRERFGVTEADLSAAHATPALRELLRFEVERADAYLRDGLPVADRLPGRLRFVVASFGLGGRRILAKIRSAGYDVLSRRPRLGKLDLLWVAGRAMTRGRRQPADPPLKEECR